MGLRKYVPFVVVLVLVAFAVNSCSGDVWAHDKSDEAKVKSEEAVGDAKEASESWTGWAMDKISENLGLKTEDAVDAATKTKDKVTDTASDAGQYGSDKAGDVKNSAAAEKVGQGKDKAYGTAEEAKRMASEKVDQTYDSTGKARDSAYETAEEAKKVAAKKSEQASHMTGKAKDKAFETAEQAKQEASEKGKEAYEMADKAKNKAYDLKGNKYSVGECLEAKEWEGQILMDTTDCERLLPNSMLHIHKGKSLGTSKHLPVCHKAALKSDSQRKGCNQVANNVVIATKFAAYL